MTSLDLIITCPYDQTHRIRKSVLSYHLVRCRKNHRTMKKQCPFDATHAIDEEQFKNHVLNCPSSANIIGQQYILEPQRQLGSVSLETVRNLSVPVMKDWKEENVPTYEPWKCTENRNIIRCLIGGTKSEKKQFKLAERARMQRLNAISICDPNLKKNFVPKAPMKRLNIEKLVRSLRRLCLEDIDTLLKSIDISKLIISEIGMKNTSMEKCIPEDIEKVVVEKFKTLALYCLKD